MVPLIVNSTERMSKMKVLAIKDSREQILNVLHKLGVLHVNVSDDLSPVDRQAIQKEKDRNIFLLGKINELISYANISEKKEIEEMIYAGPAEQLDKEVTDL